MLFKNKIIFSAFLLLPVCGVCAGNLLVLDEDAAVNYAMENNLEILSAREETSAASFRIEGARSEFFPRLDVIGHYSAYRDHPTMPFDSNSGYRIEISQNIFTGGRITRSLQSAGSELEASRWRLEETSNRVRFRVREAFYAVLLAGEAAAINEEAYELARKLLDATEQRFQKGEASHYELLRQRVETENLRSEALKSKNSFEQAKNYLKAVIGASPGDSVEAEGSLEFEPLEIDAYTIRSRALSGRPSVREAQSLLESAGYRVRAAYSGRLPSVFLSLSNIANREEAFGGDRGRYEDYWEGRVTVVVPVFDGGFTGSRVREAKSAERNISFFLDRQIKNADVEIENALLEIASSSERVRFQKKNVQNAMEAYSIINKRYLAGEAAHIDVMDARLALSAARLNYAGSLRDYKTAAASLELAAGGDVFSNEYSGGGEDE